MRRSFLFLALAVSVSGYAAEEAAHVGLEDAKKFAVSHNLEVLSLRRKVEETKATGHRALSPFFPKIGIAGGADSRVSTVGKGTEAAPLAYLYASYNLFNGFEDTYRSQVADLEAEKAGIKLRQAEFRVGLEVERQFHTYLYKKCVIELKEQALELNETHKRMAAQRRATAMGSDADVMEFDLRESLLKSDIASLKQQMESTRVQLRRLFGEEVGTQMEPSGHLQHQHIKGALMDYVKRMQSQNEQIGVASRDLAIAGVESKLWGSRWLPKVDIETKAGYLPIDIRPSPDGMGLSGQVVARFDLFSGFDAFWERREREAKRQRGEAELKQSILTAVSKAEIAYREIKAIQERVDLEEKNEERAKRYYHAILSEYRRGVKNSVDVKVAAEVLFESGVRRENYKFEFLNEKLELEQLLGSAVEIEKIEERG